MKIIDGKNAVLGRLSSYAAKEARKGEEIAVLNCQDVIITGNRTSIRNHFEEKRTKIGSGQMGPKISRSNEKIVKRAIRGMIGEHRSGKGKEAFRRVKCYNGVPKEFESSEKISFDNKNKGKFVRVQEIFR